MKIKALLSLLILVMSFLSCMNNSNSGNSTTLKIEESATPDTLSGKDIDSKEKGQGIVREESHEFKKKSQTDSTKVEDPKLKYLKTFIPEGFEFAHYYEGDLNRDELKNDVILVTYPLPFEGEKNMDEAGSCLILTRNEDQRLSLRGRNDNAVLCRSCGGVFGDPFAGVTIKNGYFSIEHYGGSSWRWTRINTFKYDEAKKDWFLHKTGGEHFHVGEPDKTEEEVKSVKDFGVIRFVDYE